MRYLIWSMEHQAWWAPGERGYVETVGEAGIYSRDRAVAIVRDANRVACHECMIPVSALTGRELRFHE
jgi:hypothetical protein